MLGWIYRMLIGNFKVCNHQYEILEELEKMGVYSGKLKAVIYISRCKHCGKIIKTTT